jgi:hypothetical protein
MNTQHIAVKTTVRHAKRVTLAAVGTLGVAAALGLGGMAQAAAAPSSGPGSTVIPLEICFDRLGQQIPCPPPGGTVKGPGGGGAGSYGGDRFPNDPSGSGGLGGDPDCLGDEVICRSPF